MIVLPLPLIVPLVQLSVPVTAPSFVVRVTFGGLAARTVEGVFEKSDSEDLGEIPLGRGDTISGRVVDPSGRPVNVLEDPTAIEELL